jgi:hypothetical protein
MGSDMSLYDLRWAAPEIIDLPMRRVVAAKPRKRQYHGRRRVLLLLSVMSAVATAAALPLVSEKIFPDAGLVTRIMYGNAVANQNYVARDILENHGQSLKFTVAGIEYTVDSPNRVISLDEQRALFAYAAWKGYPVYSNDGPLSIDP